MGEGEGGGGLNREGDLFERGGLIEDLWSNKIYCNEGW